MKDFIKREGLPFLGIVLGITYLLLTGCSHAPDQTRSWPSYQDPGPNEPQGPMTGLGSAPDRSLRGQI